MLACLNHFDACCSKLQMPSRSTIFIWKFFFIFCIADTRLSHCLIIDVNYVLGLLHCVGMGSFGDILEVHACRLYTLALKMEPAPLPFPHPLSATTREQNSHFSCGECLTEGRHIISSLCRVVGVITDRILLALYECQGQSDMLCCSMLVHP
jgi:hypothetical protein